MYLDLGKISTLVEVIHEYELVVQLKKLYKVSTTFFDGDVPALIPDTIPYIS